MAATATFTGYAVAGREPGVTLVQERTTAVIVLALVTPWVLVILPRPLNPWKVALLISVAAAFVATLAVPNPGVLRPAAPVEVGSMAAVGIAAIAIGLLELGWQIIEWHRRR